MASERRIFSPLINQIQQPNKTLAPPLPPPRSLPPSFPGSHWADDCSALRAVGAPEEVWEGELGASEGSSNTFGRCDGLFGRLRTGGAGGVEGRWGASLLSPPQLHLLFQPFRACFKIFLSFHSSLYPSTHP